LIIKDDKYCIDFEDLENQLKKSKLLLLCNPHNPTGKLFDKNDLSKLIDLALKYNVIIVSDEIHSDIIYDNKIFDSILSIKKANDITVVLNSASKIFNIASLHCSYAISKNKSLYTKLKISLSKYHFNQIDAFGSKATSIGYNKCSYWIDDLVKYLQDNRDFVIDFISKNIPKIKIIKPEGTYLLWLDFREFDLSHKEIEYRLLYNCKLALNNGLDFGKITNKFFRLNFATQKDRLKLALDRLQKEFYI
jgi:cystathionine beta-lyase